MDGEQGGVGKRMTGRERRCWDVAIPLYRAAIVSASYEGINEEIKTEH